MTYLLLILTSFQAFCSLNNREQGDTYIWKGDTDGPARCYTVSEIQIMPDSTYIRRDYGCGKPRDVRNYKHWDVETSHGFIRKSNQGFIMTQYLNSQMTDFNWYMKIKRSHIQFFYKSYKNVNLQQKTGQKVKLRFDVGLVVYHIHPVSYIREKHEFSFYCTRFRGIQKFQFWPLPPV